MTESGITYPVPQDKRMIQVEVLKDIEWQDKTYKNAESVITMRDFYYQKLVEQFGTN
jgi:hypothetical protein